MTETFNIDPSLYLEGEKTSSSLFNGMNTQSLTNNEISLISKHITSGTNLTIEKWLEILEKKLILENPYPNREEIPELKIKDEENFTSGEKIKFYDIYKDKKFNICKNCGKNDNQFFCTKCIKNLCQFCSKDCILKKHDLKNLNDEEKISASNITKIDQIIDKLYERNKMEIKLLTNDIKFLVLIIKKKYKNYFNYKNIKEGSDYIESIYYDAKYNDCLKITYSLNFKKYKGKDIKIFGSTFVNNNKDKISLIINNKKAELMDKIVINDNYLEIILIQKSKSNNGEKNFITNMSFMFCGCKSSSIVFSRVKDYKLIDLSKVEDISGLFKDCINLDKINLKFFKNMPLIKNMGSLFSNCKKLVKILNISSLDTKNVTNIDSMFYNCKKLKSLKKFNLKADGLESFSNIFYNCSALKSLPDISQWDMSNAKTLKRMFSGCKNLKNFPKETKLSKWKLKNVVNMEEMFLGCEGLESFTDISNWKLENVETMEGMFSGCKNIKDSPDFTEWNLKNIKNLDKIFYDSFIKRIDFENWNIGNLDMVSKIQVINRKDESSDDDEDDDEDYEEESDE